MFQGVCYAGDADWELVNQAASKLFKGVDLKVTLNIGNGDEGVEKGIELEIPLISWEEREKRRKAKANFLKEGADIIRGIEENEAILKVKNEEVEVLKKSMINEGIEGIKRYFEIKGEIATTKALISQMRRELEALCGKK